MNGDFGILKSYIELIDVWIEDKEKSIALNKILTVFENELISKMEITWIHLD